MLESQSYTPVIASIGTLARKLGPVLSVGAAAVVLLLALQSHVVRGINPDNTIVRLMTLAVVGIGGIQLSYAMLVPPLRIFFRILCLVPLAFFGTAGVPLDAVEQPGLEQAIVIVRWFGLAAAVLALVRPSFLPCALFALCLHRVLLSGAFGGGLTQTDISAVVEGPSVLAFALCFARLFALIPSLSSIFTPVLFNHTDNRPTQFSTQEGLFLVAVGVHLANYYYSALAKITLPGGPTDWLLNNPTSVLMENAWELGMLPIAHWPGLSATVLAFSIAANPLINFLTLGVQIAAPLGIIWRRWLIGLTLAYDVLHIGIYLLTGIFFWKWMVLNAAVVAAAIRIRVPRFPLIFAFLAAAALFASPVDFRISRLGWYDTRQVTHSFAKAITKDGVEFDVPSNYFLGVSVGFAQMDTSRIWPETSTETGTWGATRNDQIFRDGNNCTASIGGKANSSGLERLKSLIQSVHRTILKNVDEQGRIQYNFYPHHIWSNLYAYDEFEQLDKRTIVAYRWVERVVCVDKREGGNSRVLAERTMLISVSEDRAKRRQRESD